MGSSLSTAAWLTIAVVCGLLFLIFDAARYFVHQVSPVTLRRWSGDSDQETRSRWLHYDPLNLRLMNGAMLQIALIVAFLATMRALDSLQLAWETGQETPLIRGIEIMFELTNLGRSVMQIAKPDGSGTYCPSFRRV